MASTLALTAASPGALKYLYAYDGVGGAGSGVATRLDNQMVADAKTAGPGPSPLAALLESISDVNDWVALPQGDKLSLACTMTSSATGLAITAAFTNNARLTVTGIDGEAGEAIIEVRFNVTPNR